jgi:hypothetical protein
MLLSAGCSPCFAAHIHPLSTQRAAPLPFELSAPDFVPKNA